MIHLSLQFNPMEQAVVFYPVLHKIKRSLEDIYPLVYFALIFP